MKKNKEIEKFVKLNKQEKGNLTLSWLTKLVKTEHLKVEDVVDILNCVEPTFSQTDKIESLLMKGNVSISSISRAFGFGYAKSKNFVQNLLNKNVIAKYNNNYKILDKEKFKTLSKEFVKEIK